MVLLLLFLLLLLLYWIWIQDSALNSSWIVAQSVATEPQARKAVCRTAIMVLEPLIAKYPSNVRLASIALMDDTLQLTVDAGFM